MRNGKKFSITSLLSILGVICFATILVSAVLITSGVINFGSTTVSAATISISKTSSPTTAFIGNDENYVFNANVGQTLIDGQITIWVNMTNIVPADLTSVKITYGSEIQSIVSMSQNGVNPDSLIGTHTVTDLTSGATHTCTIVIVYAVAGTYDVAVKMSGNA
jgi:hypothetical protein